MSLPRRQRPAPGNVLLGIVLVARGRPDGLRYFGDTPQAFLASLAPLLAFPLVGGTLMLAQGGGLAAVTDLLATLCALLAPPVLSYEPARLWQRQAYWLRFATALNWCQWVIPVLALGMLIIVYPLVQGLLSAAAAADTVIALLAAYALWLHWFLARHALMISPLRAVLLVVVVNLGTVLLVIGPSLLDPGVLANLRSLR